MSAPPATGSDAPAAAWQPVANLLEDHSSAQEEGADPVLLKEGSDEATEGTNNARPAEEERDVNP